MWLLIILIRFFIFRWPFAEKNVGKYTCFFLYLHHPFIMYLKWRCLPNKTSSQKAWLENNQFSADIVHPRHSSYITGNRLPPCCHCWENIDWLWPNCEGTLSSCHLEPFTPQKAWINIDLGKRNIRNGAIIRATGVECPHSCRKFFVEM